MDTIHHVTATTTDSTLAPVGSQHGQAPAPGSVGTPGQRLRVSTDGSVRPGTGTGAWSWTTPDGRVWAAGAAHAAGADINELETRAVLEAVTAAHPQAKLRVFTDSAGLADAFAAARAGRRVTRYWRSRLGPLLASCEGRDVVVTWVRGHHAHRGNRRADKLALHTLRAAVSGAAVSVDTLLRASAASALAA